MWLVEAWCCRTCVQNWKLTRVAKFHGGITSKVSFSVFELFTIDIELFFSDRLMPRKSAQMAWKLPLLFKKPLHTEETFAYGNVGFNPLSLSFPHTKQSRISWPRAMSIKESGFSAQGTQNLWLVDTNALFFMSVLSCTCLHPHVRKKSFWAEVYSDKPNFWQNFNYILEENRKQ